MHSCVRFIDINLNLCDIMYSLSLTPNPFPVVKGCVCLVGSASCRAFGHTRPASLPGLSVGLPPLVQARMLAVSHTKPLHDAVAQMADDLYGGYAPKQGRFGCLPKVLHDAKPTEQAISDTHIFRKYKGLSTVCGQRISFVLSL